MIPIGTNLTPKQSVSISIKHRERGRLNLHAQFDNTNEIENMAAGGNLERDECRLVSLQSQPRGERATYIIFLYSCQPISTLANFQS